jgi:hypothetical protein
LLDRRWVDAFTPLVGRFVDEFTVGIIRAARNFARTPRCPIVDGFDAFTSLLGRLIDQSAVAISELHAASLGRGDARSPTDLDVFSGAAPSFTDDSNLRNYPDAVDFPRPARGREMRAVPSLRT